MEAVQFINKWIHLLGISAMVGGVVFGWMVLSPALTAESVRGTDLARALWRRFGLTLAGIWVIVLATGFFNYYLVAPSVTGSYHMLIGMKIVLVFIMLILTTALAHPMRLFEKIQANRGPWLLLTTVIALCILGISTELNMGRMSGHLLKAPVPVVGAPAGPVNQPAPGAAGGPPAARIK